MYRNSVDLRAKHASIAMFPFDFKEGARHMIGVQRYMRVSGISSPVSCRFNIISSPVLGKPSITELEISCESNSMMRIMMANGEMMTLVSQKAQMLDFFAPGSVMLYQRRKRLKRRRQDVARLLLEIRGHRKPRRQE